MKLVKKKYKVSTSFEKPKPKEETVTMIIADEFANVETKVTDLMLKNIGSFIAEGLNEEEACLLANFDYSVFKEAKKKSIVVENYIRRQMIKLKQKHLKIIQANPSDKNSQWILEKVFPEEYGGSKKKDTENPLNVLANIIRTIQHDPRNNIIRDANATDRTDSGSQGNIPVVEVAAALG